MGAAAKAHVARIQGVDISKINVEHLTGVMRDLKLDVDDIEGQVDALVLRLSMHFGETIKNADLLAECDNCDGVSDASLEACPFCGYDDTSSTPEAKAETKGKATSSTTTTETNKEATTMAASKGKVATKSEKSTEVKPAKTAPKPSNALAVAPKADLVPGATIKDLDSAVVEVQKMKGDAAASMHLLGGKILAIYERQLWKLRTDDGGKSKYKGFDAFCAHELGMTPQNAYSLMDVSKNFTADDVRKFGTSKLGLLLQAPKEDQERIKKNLVEKGASKREVEREVRRTKQEKGHRREGRDGKARPAGEKKSAKVRRENITVAKILGRSTVKLWAKALDKAGKKVPAKKITDLPWGEVELENGIIEQFHVQETPGGELRLVIERKRSEE
jgi:hypothetical protein